MDATFAKVIARFHCLLVDDIAFEEQVNFYRRVHGFAPGSPEVATYTARLRAGVNLYK